MITIQHEGHGPYIERTIIDYGGIRNYADVPGDSAFEAIIANQDDTPENLRERVKELEAALDDAQREKDDLETEKDDEIDTLTKELEEANARLDESDPGQTLRDDLAALRRQMEALESRYAGIRRSHETQATEINQLRAANQQLKRGIALTSVRSALARAKGE